MKRVKFIKKMIVFALTLVMCCGIGSSVKAAENKTSLPDGWRRMGLTDEQLEQLNDEIQPREPAPGLSSLAITDLAIDERNEIHIEVRVMGTAKGILCWCDGLQCVDNINESKNIVSGNRVIGEYRYFHTGIYYSDSVVGKRIYAEAQATNAMMPWNTLTASYTFTVPKLY